MSANCQRTCLMCFSKGLPCCRRLTWMAAPDTCRPAGQKVGCSQGGRGAEEGRGRPRKARQRQCLLLPASAVASGISACFGKQGGWQQGGSAHPPARLLQRGSALPGPAGRAGLWASLAGGQWGAACAAARMWAGVRPACRHDASCRVASSSKASKSKHATQGCVEGGGACWNCQRTWQNRAQAWLRQVVRRPGSAAGWPWAPATWQHLQPGRAAGVSAM
jgi:hypothetical protein